MNCKSLRKRSKKYLLYFYCAKKKMEIKLSDCYSCALKEYKEIKKSKTKKHKRTKATDISQAVKEEVWNRDNYKCIFCHTEVPKSNANAHFITRSAGGLGIPQNVFTACNECHHEQDNGKNTKEYDKLAENHLKKCYGDNWDKSKLIYKKY